MGSTVTVHSSSYKSLYSRWVKNNSLESDVAQFYFDLVALGLTGNDVKAHVHPAN